jgi:hydroxyisourate hydrolase
MRIELWAVSDAQRQLIKSVITNQDGRTEQPLLGPDEMKAGIFELVFHVNEYFTKAGPVETKAPFLDTVPIRFGIADATASYHVPLLASPWAYSTYRGS